MVKIASSQQLRASLWRWLLVLVPGLVLLGFLSGTASGSIAANPWFAALVKPAIYPPPATFGIVWTLLYILMAVALALVITASGARGRRPAIALFIVQFALNLAWSPLFFAGHQILGALLLLAAIDVAVLATTLAFARVRPIAALLLVPYLAWVLFATALNWQFWQANPQADGQPAPVVVLKI